MSEPLEISVHVEEKRYQPTQEKTVVPDWEPVEVTPDRGYALSKVTVEGIPEPTDTETFTENGEYNVGRIGTAIVDVDIDLQDKTVTPTEQTQTVEADTGYDGLDTVTVNPIPPEYVVPSGSVNITANGQVSVSGKATANVNVPQGVFPSGTKVITQNVTGEDVTNYAAVDVAVPGPTGTKQISITQNGTTTEDVSEYAEAEIAVNTDPAKGLMFEDYDSDGFPHSARFVGMWATVPSHYMDRLLLSDGYSANLFFGKKISTIIIPDSVQKLAAVSLYGCTALTEVVFPNGKLTLEREVFRGCSNITEFVFHDDVIFDGAMAFNGCLNATRFIFGGNVNAIKEYQFYLCKTILYDFSHCTTITPLYNVAALGRASGCVIRIPAALSDTTLGTGNGWESATNWSALTNIVWEVV